MALAATYGITADAGATFQRQIVWKDANSEAVDLSGYTAEMVIRDRTTSATVILTLSTANGRITLGGAAGTIDLLVSAADMGVAAGRYSYTLELTDASSIVSRLLQGEFILRSEVFRL
jgi:hypothetical protein